MPQSSDGMNMMAKPEETDEARSTPQQALPPKDATKVTSQLSQSSDRPVGQGIQQKSMSERLPGRAADPSPESLLLRPVDTAKALSISPRMLWALTHKGEIPCIKIGRSVRYDPRDLTEWIDKKKHSKGEIHETA